MQKIDAKAQIIANMTQERWEDWNERAGILQHCAGHTRAEAEDIALSMKRDTYAEIPKEEPECVRKARAAHQRMKSDRAMKRGDV